MQSTKSTPSPSPTRFLGSLLRITRARTTNAATYQITPTARTRAIIVWISVRSARARGEKRRHGSTGGLRAVAGGVEADGAGAWGGARGTVVVVEGDVAAGYDARGGTTAGADDGNTETLDIADVDEWCATVVTRFDQAAAVDVVGIIVFADGDASSPVSGIDRLERVPNGAIAGVADCGWGARVVAEGGEEAISE